LERDFCDFAKVIRIATYFKELLEMLQSQWLFYESFMYIKFREERGQSIHHGKTSPHRIQDVGNWVKCALRPFRVIFIDFPDPVWLGARWCRPPAIPSSPVPCDFSRSFFH
jgi:hypothetical protein